MDLNETQYERVARFLDGEPIRLTAQERAAADEIRRDEAAVSAAMDVPAPSLDRARARMRAELARPRLRTWRAAVYAAVAAAVVVAFVAFWPRQTPPVTPGEPPAVAGVDAAFVDALARTTVEDEFDLIEQDIRDLAADIVVPAVPAPIDLRIRAVEEDTYDLLWDFPSDPLGGPA